MMSSVPNGTYSFPLINVSNSLLPFISSTKVLTKGRLQKIKTENLVNLVKKVGRW